MYFHDNSFCTVYGRPGSSRHGVTTPTAAIVIVTRYQTLNLEAVIMQAFESIFGTDQRFAVL